jgi:uncharacterized protein
MSRVIFDVKPAAPHIDTRRADVACFVGLARVLAGAALSSPVVSWLQTLGYSTAQSASLTNVPIPIESYGVFTAMFDDGSSGLGFGTDYLAATVRTFFAQGGKKCYVVRVGDPVTDTDFGAGKAAKLQAILGAAPQTAGAVPDGPLAWTGVAALGALEDPSLLVVPDLTAVCASETVGVAGQVPVVPLGPQEFTVCSPGPVIPQQQRTFQAPAPRLAVADYSVWAAAVTVVLSYLATSNLRHQLLLREIQFVAAFPMPLDLDVAGAAQNPSSSAIAQDIHAVIDAQMPEVPFTANTYGPQIAQALGQLMAGQITADQFAALGFTSTVDGNTSWNISSAFLQLAYPWLKTSSSSLLLEQLEPADGALAGLIARNALTRGTFTSATKIVPSEIYDVSPALPAQETKSSATALQWATPGSPPKALIERFSLFGLTAVGLRLLSDVTAYPGETYRSGAVNRLVSVIFRAARTMGEAALFENNGPALWGRVQRYLQNLMTRLWQLNALDGATVNDAFNVLCNSGTMSQNDLDNGRLIAQLTFTPAATIETIRVQLALEAGGTSAQEIAANQSTAVAALGNVAGGSMAGAY